MRRARRLAALAAVALLALPAAAAAQDCPQTSVPDIEDEVMCPVCELPLALATEEPQAERERAFIMGLVERCRSKEEIKAALVAEFGESVLATPDDEGFDLAAYLVPALAVAFAAVGIALAVGRWRRSRAPATSTPGASADDAARVEADLRRYDL